MERAMGSKDPAAGRAPGETGAPIEFNRRHYFPIALYPVVDASLQHPIADYHQHRHAGSLRAGARQPSSADPRRRFHLASSELDQPGRARLALASAPHGNHYFPHWSHHSVPSAQDSGADRDHRPERLANRQGRRRGAPPFAFTSGAGRLVRNVDRGWDLRLASGLGCLAIDTAASARRAEREWHSLDLAVAFSFLKSLRPNRLRS